MAETSIETPGVVAGVEPGSVAAALELRAGDEIIAVNGERVQDVIDVLFYASDDEVEIDFVRAGVRRAVAAARAEGQALGLEFTHPTFDIDIRRCNNLCPFCFVLQTAPRMRRTLYIKDDDYRYSFLYGHFVTLTNLDAPDWERIERQRLSPLYVSVHATDLDVRRKCLRNDAAPDIVAQLQWLGARGIKCHTQIVVTPGLNDGPQLERSVRDLANLWPAVRSVSIVPVGLTKHHRYGHRSNTRAEALATLASVHAWQVEFSRALGAPFVHATDEWYLVTDTPVPPRAVIEGLDLEENGLGQVRGFLDAWQDERTEVVAHATTLCHRSATLVTGELFGPTLARVAEEFSQLTDATLHILPMRNERLGHTITVAGLLMGAEVSARLASRPADELVILPRVMFDHPQGISLDDISPLDIARKLGAPVCLADRMGDVLDAMTGANSLRFDPQDQDIPDEVARAGGWSLEKYL